MQPASAVPATSHLFNGFTHHQIADRCRQMDTDVNNRDFLQLRITTPDIETIILYE